MELHTFDGEKLVQTLCYSLNEHEMTQQREAHKDLEILCQLIDKKITPQEALSKIHEFAAQTPTPLLQPLTQKFLSFPLPGPLDEQYPTDTKPPVITNCCEAISGSGQVEITAIGVLDCTD